MPGTHIRTEDHSLKVFVPFDEDGPRAQGGGPVLERVKRPRAKPITEWASRDELQLAVSFMFNSIGENAHLGTEDEGVEIEQNIRILEKMRGQDAGSPEPPQLIVLGDPEGCIPNDYHDASHLRWWLEEIQADDDKTERNHAGNRTRYAGVLIFTEVVEDEPLGNLKASNHRNNNTSSASKYTVKKGDTLSGIAKKFKIKGGWHALAKLNKIRDPKRLRVGQVIRLK
jgi:nucleoid-associated protein YgaU